jgi:cell division protein FtsN
MFKLAKGLEITQPSRAFAMKDSSINFIKLGILSVLVALALLLQPACLFRGHKTDVKPQSPPSPIRIAVLPFNVPADDGNLRWASLASQVMMAKAGEGTPDLEIIPFWEAMPAAVQVAGASRSITPEAAVNIAGRLTAKWATQGELSQSKNGVSMMVDFLPADGSLYPFRFSSEGSLESVEQSFPEAFEQFLRYLAARPLNAKGQIKFDAGSLRETAEALDREYGWFVSADPGKSENVVEKLLRSDERLARTLFNPNLYPGIRGRRSEALPKDSAPAQPAAAARTVPAQSAAQAQAAPGVKAAQTSATSGQSASEASSKPQPIDTTAYVPPPPRTFSQKLDVNNKAGQSDRSNPPKAVASNTNKDSRRSNENTQVETGSKAPPAARNKASPQGFGIQVGALRSKEEADTVAAKLAQAGRPAEIEVADLKEKGIWYRIRIYGFESRQAAVSAGEKLLSAGLISGFWPIP